MKRLLLLIALIAIGAVIAFGNLARMLSGPDLSDRNPDFAHRILPPAQLFFPDCVKNFSTDACTHPVHLLVVGPKGSSDTSSWPLADELSHLLPFAYLSQIQFSRDTADYDCSNDLADLRSWLTENAHEQPTIVAVPRNRFGCLERVFHDRYTSDHFLVFHHGRVVADITCAAPDQVPNPLCDLRYHLDRGRYPVTLSGLPARNIGQVARRFPKALALFLDALPPPLPFDLAQIDGFTSLHLTADTQAQFEAIEAALGPP